MQDVFRSRQAPSVFKRFQWCMLALSLAVLLNACGGGSSVAVPVADELGKSPASGAATDSQIGLYQVDGAFAPPPVSHFRPDPAVIAPDSTLRTRTAAIDANFAAHVVVDTTSLEVARSVDALADGRFGPRQIAIGRDLTGAKSAAEVQRHLQWRESANGLSAELAIAVPGAAGARVGLLVEKLPDAALLRIYAPRGSIEHVLTGAQVKAQLQSLQGPAKGVLGRFWTPYVSGSQIVVAVDLPAGVPSADVRISAPRVSHFFEAPVPGLPDAHLSEAVAPRIGESGSCNLDATCYAQVATEMDAVARLLITTETGSSGLCTGTLLNDRGNTGTPYLITANHCISKQSEASSLQTFWFYRSSSCGSGVLSSRSVTRTGGAVLLFNTSQSDVSFVRLNNAAPAGAWFLGWSPAVPTLGQAVAGIHHPRGDLLKAAFGQARAWRSCASSGGTTLSCSTAASAASSQFIEAQFTSGTTEGGSSGSALMSTVDGSMRFIGQLYGGSSSCTFRDGTNMYGRFDVSYNLGIGPFLEATTAPITYPMQVRKSGNGSGTVTSTPLGIACGGACTQHFASNATVVLTAVAGAGSTFEGWGGACSGQGTCSLPMSQARNVTATFSMPFINLNTALDNATLSFSTGGTQGFFGQTQYAYAGSSSAQSGSIGHSQVSDFSTTVVGPGQVSFAWKTSSELSYDYLRFYVGGVQRNQLSGSSQWITVTFEVGAGLQTLRWAYEKDGSVAEGLDAAWVDRLQFVATSAASTTSTTTTTATSAIVNGGFESTGGWTFSPSSLIYSRPAGVPALADSGNSVAWVCGYNNCNERMSQVVNVPANASALVVDFWRYIQTQESLSAIYDTLTVEVLSVTNPANRTVVAVLSNRDAGSAWQRVTREFNGFAGQTVELRFTGQSDFSLLTSFYVDNVQLSFRYAAPPAIQPETGWYWNPTEGGRGWAIERQGDNIFAAAFMYESSGQPVWYVSTLARQSDGSFMGNLLRYSGGQSLLGAWRSPTPSAFATLRLRFSSAQTANFEVFSVPQGTAPTVAMESGSLARFPISTPTPFAASSGNISTGWWWNEAEPGRGYFIEVQGAEAFVAQFGYTILGNANWYASSMRVSAQGGRLMSAAMNEYGNGQSLGGSYRTPVISGSPGSWTFLFTSGNTGELTLPDGRVVPIRRFLF